MPVHPHPEADRLADGLDRCLGLAAAWEGDVCRASRPKYATVKRLVDGEGAKRFGGRWNPPGIRAAYFALDEETALSEVKQRHRRGGLRMGAVLPRIFVALRVRLTRVLDLRAAEVLRLLGLSTTRLCEEWQDRGDEEPLTQAIGRLAWERRLDGLLVPSVPGLAHGGANLVVYRDHTPAGWFDVYNREELPPEATAPA